MRLGRGFLLRVIRNWLNACLKALRCALVLIFFKIEMRFHLLLKKLYIQVLSMLFLIIVADHLNTGRFVLKHKYFRWKTIKVSRL